MRNRIPRSVKFAPATSGHRATDEQRTREHAPREEISRRAGRGGAAFAQLPACCSKNDGSDDCSSPHAFHIPVIRRPTIQRSVKRVQRHKRGGKRHAREETLILVDSESSDRQPMALLERVNGLLRRLQRKWCAKGVRETLCCGILLNWELGVRIAPSLKFKREKMRPCILKNSLMKFQIFFCFYYLIVTLMHKAQTLRAAIRR